MTTINYSADGKLYFIARDGCVAQFCLGTDELPSHADPVDQEIALQGGDLLINVTAKDGTRYCRAVSAVSPDQIEIGQSEPISESDVRFKDYALFHRWHLAA